MFRVMHLFPYQPQVIAKLLGCGVLPGEFDLGAGCVEGGEGGLSDHFLMGIEKKERAIRLETEQCLFWPRS